MRFHILFRQIDIHARDSALILTMHGPEILRLVHLRSCISLTYLSPEGTYLWLLPCVHRLIIVLFLASIPYLLCHLVW